MENQLFNTPEELEKQLGVQARQLRRRQALTQVELAKRANVSLSAIKYLEAGRGSSLATVVRVARALGRSDWLISFAPPEPSYSPLAAFREQNQTARPKKTRVHATDQSDARTTR